MTRMKGRDGFTLIELSVTRNKVWAGLVLLFLVFAGVWWFFPRQHRDIPPTVAKRLAALRWEEPWYYRLLKRTNTLRFLPKGWFAQYSARDLPWRRLNAVLGFGPLGTNAWPAVPALVELVKHKNMEIAVAAAQALASIKAEEHPEWGRLQRNLAGQTSAARALNWLLAGPNQFGQPVDHAQRRFGLIGLAATGSAAVVARRDILEVLKTSPDNEFRSYALMALGAMDSSSNTVLILKEVLQNPEEWPTVSASAAQVLAVAAPHEPETRRLLEQALQERRSHVRVAAARALWRLQAPPEEILPVLTALLHHPLATVRAGALDGLAEMGSAARKSQTEMEPLLQDENAMVRRSAGAALKSIGGGAGNSGQSTRVSARESFHEPCKIDPERYRGGHGLRLFRGAACASGLREGNRTLKSLWWQGCRLPTAFWLTDITVEACAGFYP